MKRREEPQEPLGALVHEVPDRARPARPGATGRNDSRIRMKITMMNTVNSAEM